MNPITYLCGVLDRLFERSPVTAMLLALAIAFACAIGIAYLGVTPESQQFPYRTTT
jgi:ABC-type dipeptide/oligopeptide/nickel transport system permease component